MNAKVEQALHAMLTNWNLMAGAESDEAESTADTFQASFYRLIDAVRDWYDELEPRPTSLEQFMALPTMRTILDRLPAPLMLNFEIEAELLYDNLIRIEDDKYD